MSVGTAALQEGLPLAPTRTAEFTTNEGTWMSLDVSPDGRSIVFDLLGDIYLLPIGGGRANVLAGGMPFEVQPRFSPDGARIVFVSDRSGSDNVWVMNADGSGATQVSRDPSHLFVSPEWDPQGDAIVTTRTWLTRRTPLELWRYTLSGDGQGQALIDQQSGMVAIGAAFASDKQRIYFSRKALAQVRPFSEIGEYQLASLDRTTGSIDPQSDTIGGGMRPALSPDGQWLVYASRFHDGTGLRLRSLASGEESWLVYPVTFDAQEAQHISLDLLPGYAFMPDSSALVVAMSGKICKVAVPSGELTPIPFEAQAHIELAPLLRTERRIDTGPVQAREVLTPALSPNGRQLAFSALGRIWISNADGSAPRRLTRGDTGEFHPSWSPDGRAVIFTSWSEETGGNVFVAAIADGAARAVTQSPALYLWPTAIPAGNGYVALRMSRQAWVDARVGSGADVAPRSKPRVQLIWISATGDGTRTLATLDQVRRPHFGPERDQVYVYLSRGLTAFKLEGGDPQVIAKTAIQREPGEKSSAVEELLLSPDGKALLAFEDNHVYRIERTGTPATAQEFVITSAPSANIKRLSQFGADLPTWTSDGRVLFPLGKTVFLSDPRQPDRMREIPVKISAPRSTPSGTVALSNARLLTMNGTQQEVIENGVVVVRDNRIVAVGAMDQVRVPANAKVLDMSGKTLMPGLVDVHAHFASVQAMHPDQPWEFLTSLAYGITTTFDPAARPAEMTHADLVDSGQFIGPRIDTTGSPILRETMQTIHSLDDMRALVRRYGKYYGHTVLKHYTSGTRIQRQWLAIAAREQGMMITAEGNGENRVGIAEIFDGFSGHEHYFTFAPFYQDLVQLLSRSGTWYTPTLLVDHGARGGEELFYIGGDVHGDRKLAQFTPHPSLDRETLRRDQFWMHWMDKQEYPAPILARSTEAVRAAGGRIGAGAHGQRQGLGLHWEMQLLSSGGMSNLEVLRTATHRGAENIGLSGDLGTLEVGKLADLLVLDGNPVEKLANTTSLRYVMKDGWLYDAESLDTVWPAAVKRKPWRYWGDDPVPAQLNRNE